MRRVINGVSAFGAAGRVLLLAAIFLLLFGAGPRSVSAQNVVNLPQLVLEPEHTEYVYTQNPDTPNIVDVKSSNPSVATATTYRVNRVQIVALALGRTDVEFFDTTQRILYRVSVWVEKSNPTGGGGAGYDPGKTQLTQIVMLANHTENVTVPGGGGDHQLSSVVSSNPSVATARTNTPNTIQIYSIALGDTFIDFTDNATGTTYQVHVWVVKNLSDRIGGIEGGNHPSPGPRPTATPKPNPIAGPRPGQLDKCLVGQWVAESADFNGKTSGGAGATVVIEANGNISADYNSMSKVVFSDGGSYSWTGRASGHISAETGLLIADRVDRSNFNFDLLDPHGKSMLSNGWADWSKTLGGIFPPSRPGMGISYTCSDSNLTIVQTVNNSRTTLVFKRQKP